MRIGSIGDIWRNFTRKTSPLVPKTAPVTDSERHLGSDDQAREALDYSAKKQQEALVYGQDGQLHDLNEHGDHPKIDEHM